MADLINRVRDKKLAPFDRLVTLMAVLRSPEGCNWDRKQTHKSLLPYLIEETYEVVEAIERGEYAELKEELGDLLCQIVFHAQLARERGEFEVDDSINCIVEKLIKRHPHVFGEKKDLQPEEVRDQWEKIKLESGENESALAGLPRSMPALTMAFRVGQKAAGCGFDWSKPEDVLEKIEEEVEEIKQEMFSQLSSGRDRIENEIGDLLFATASLARKLEIDPEAALKRALDKFRHRYERLEAEIGRLGGRLEDYTSDRLEEIWQDLKKRQ